MSPKTAAARPAPLTSTDYLKQVLTARVYDVAVESDLDPARNLGRRLHNKIFLKREDQQPVFSFKLRGAYNKMAHLTPEQLKAGVICASAGNHAQGVALGGHKLGARAVIVMPTTTPQVKVDAVKQLGGEVVLAGDSYSDAYEHAVKLQAEQGLTFIHPFDDPLVIAGQGTIGMEILRQHQGPLHAVFVAIGGGGLISGVGAYIKAIRPEVKVIGVQMRDSDAMAQSVGAGKHVTLPDSPTAPPSSAWAMRPSASPARWSTSSSPSTPTPCAPPSRTCSSTPAASSSPRAPWRWRPSSSTWPRTRPRARATWPSCRAPT